MKSILTNKKDYSHMFKIFKVKFIKENFQKTREEKIVDWIEAIVAWSFLKNVISSTCCVLLYSWINSSRFSYAKVSEFLPLYKVSILFLVGIIKSVLDFFSIIRIRFWPKKIDPYCRIVLKFIFNETQLRYLTIHLRINLYDLNLIFNFNLSLLYRSIVNRAQKFI